jgi:hypothetical protein
MFQSAIYGHVNIYILVVKTHKHILPLPMFNTVAHDDFLYVFGGRSGYRLLNDMFKFDTLSFSWQSIPHLIGSTMVPSPRHFFASCASKDYMYVYGGLWEEYPDEIMPLNADSPSFQVWCDVHDYDCCCSLTLSFSHFLFPIYVCFSPFACLNSMRSVRRVSVVSKQGTITTPPPPLTTS